MGFFTFRPGPASTWWQRHALSVVLTGLLVAQTVAFWLLRLPEWVGDQELDGESTALWPGFWLHFAGEWMVSVLADTYGALLIVVATKRWREVGSAESN